MIAHNELLWAKSSKHLYCNSPFHFWCFVICISSYIPIQLQTARLKCSSTCKSKIFFFSIFGIMPHCIQFIYSSNFFLLDKLGKNKITVSFLPFASLDRFLFTSCPLERWEYIFPMWGISYLRYKCLHWKISPPISVLVTTENWKNGDTHSNENLKVVVNPHYFIQIGYPGDFARISNSWCLAIGSSVVRLQCALLQLAAALSYRRYNGQLM